MTVDEPVWIEEPEVVALHLELLARHGGAAGVRNIGALRSALAKPRQLAAYVPAADLADLAAAYTFGIVKNHSFVDGNKRIGFVAGILFLELNGYRFTALEAVAAGVVLAVAAGTMDQAEYAAFLREHASPE